MPRRSSLPRTGFTLIELVVVLVLVAMSAAIVAPLLRPRPTLADPRRTVVARARRVAVDRAQPLGLTIAANGSWIVATRPDRATLLTGRLEGPQHPLSLALTPLGACIPERGEAFDAAACAPLAP